MSSTLRRDWTSGLTFRGIGLCVAALVVAGLSARPAAAQYTWNVAAGGNWNAAGNWVGGLPVSGATATLTFGSAATQASTYTATNDIGAAGTPFALNLLTVNNTAGTVTLAGNPLNFTGTAPQLSVTGAGNLIVSAALNLSSADAVPNVILGGAGTGAITFSGLITGGLNNLIKTSAGNLTISGGGTMNQLSLQNGNTFITGGTLALTAPTGDNSLSGFQLGSAAGQIATATISGGATVNVTENVYIGDIAGSTGTLTVTGAGTVLNALGGASNRLGVGNFGSGTLNITNGGVVNAQRLFTPRQAGSSSTITIDGTGSTLRIVTQASIMSNGVGNVNIQNGGQFIVDATAVAFNMAPIRPAPGRSPLRERARR